MWSRHTPFVASVERLQTTLRAEVLPIIGRVPAYGKLMYTLLTSREVANAEKAALLLALGYQVSPIDLIPGFIPVIGQLDDLLVMLWGVRRTLEALAPEVAALRLAEAGLTQEQVEADTEVLRRALRDTMGRGAALAGRGAMAGLRAAVSVGAYVGFTAYYLGKALVGRRREHRA